MFERSKLKSALGAAEAVLKEKAHVVDAIERERTKLTGLLDAREAAEAEVAEAEIANNGDAARARKKLDSKRAEIEEVSLKLRKLRGMLAAFSGRLVEARAVLKRELPAHFDSIRQQFTAEWNEAATAFAEALGKRRAIEALTGEPLALSDPAPGAAELPAAFSEPSNRLEEMKTALTNIAAMRNAGAPPVFYPGMEVRHYDPTVVYVLKRACEGLPNGTKVIAASLCDGHLAALVQAGGAEPAGLAAEHQAEWSAQIALMQMDQEDAEESNRRAREQEKAHWDAQDGQMRPANIYPDLSPEERRKRIHPTAAELAEMNKQAEEEEQKRQDEAYRDELARRNAPGQQIAAEKAAIERDIDAAHGA